MSPKDRRTPFPDGLALVATTLAGLACHLGWAHVHDPQLLFASVMVVAVVLIAWTRWLWSRVTLWLTKFFCIAAVIDLLTEGFLQPFHGTTVPQKLLCQMMLFGAYAIYLALLRPLDVWLAGRLRR